MGNNIFTNQFGTIITFKPGTNIIHREDGPAIETKDGVKEWWFNGERHRTDGPAIEDPLYNNYSWWVNGKRHREGGPAYISSYYKAWYINDKLHREDGPAICNWKHQEWHINGERLSKEKEIILNKWWDNKKP